MTLIEEARQTASERDVTLLNRRVNSFGTPLRIVCEAGHEQRVQAVRFLGEDWECRSCKNQRTLYCVEEKLSVIGWRLDGVDGFSKSNTVKAYCDRGHYNSMLCETVRRGRISCRQCNEDEKRERARQIVKDSGGICLSDSLRKESEVYLRLRCASGHEWTSRIHNVLKGQWCKKCGVDNLRRTIADAECLAEVNGGRCLSKVYKNSYTKLRWECAEGHKFRRPLSTMYGVRRFCPECESGAAIAIPWEVPGAKRKSAMEAFAEARRAAEERGGRCLSENYKNNRTKLRWTCSEGHEWEAAPANVVHRKSWCPTCARNSSWIERAHQTADKFGGQVLSKTFERVTQSITWQCAKGHVFDKKLNSINGVFCGRCQKEERGRASMRRIADRIGGVWLGTEYRGWRAADLWRCKNGHEFEDTANAVWKLGCRQCGVSAALARAEEMRRRIDRPGDTEERVTCKECEWEERERNRNEEKLRTIERIATAAGFAVVDYQYGEGRPRYVLECRNGHRQLRTNVMSSRWRGNCPECANEERVAKRVASAQKRFRTEKQTRAKKEVVVRNDKVYFCDGETAAAMGISKKTLQNRVSMGSPVPRFISVPGSRRRWLRRDVERWLMEYRGKAHG